MIIRYSISVLLTTTLMGYCLSANSSPSGRPTTPILTDLFVIFSNMFIKSWKIVMSDELSVMSNE
jgi:hypothetical protein